MGRVRPEPALLARPVATASRCVQVGTIRHEVVTEMGAAIAQVLLIRGVDFELVAAPFAPAVGHFPLPLSPAELRQLPQHFGSPSWKLVRWNETGGEGECSERFAVQLAGYGADCALLIRHPVVLILSVASPSSGRLRSTRARSPLVGTGMPDAAASSRRKRLPADDVPQRRGGFSYSETSRNCRRPSESAVRADHPCRTRPPTGAVFAHRHRNQCSVRDRSCRSRPRVSRRHFVDELDNLLGGRHPGRPRNLNAGLTAGGATSVVYG